MSFQSYSEYSDFLASMSASKDKTVCYICQDGMDGPAGIDDQKFEGEYLLATCRFPCGCTFHHACIAKCREFDSRFRRCPSCRTDMFPRMPICPGCDEEIRPEDTVTTFPNSRMRMHFLCSVESLKVNGPRLPGQSVEQMQEATRSIRPRPNLSQPPSLTSAATAAAAAPRRSGPLEPLRQSSTHRPPPPPADDEDEEVLLLGEMTRDSEGRRTWRSRSPIQLDE